jgi:circadian clock protein KaiC
MIDLINTRGIPAVFTTLRGDGSLVQEDDLGVSSLMDSWVKLQNMEANGERTRTLYVIKARGMSHSNQVREFLMSSTGIRLIEAYIGPAGVLTGTARAVQEAQETAEMQRRLHETERRIRDVARRRSAIERQIEELRASLEATEDEEERLRVEDRLRAANLEKERRELTARRSAAE